ncbi:MAG: VOC family protein [Candidatus Hinthialibacter antarcticus]|nr:VOC family protein [Candidatus Hinthialibacter antarcticus]
MNCFSGFDHPAIAAKNSAALSKWYCEMLGYTVAAQNADPAFLLKAPDGTFLEIMSANDDPRAERQNHTPGLSHLAFRVSSFDEALKWLDERGVEWFGEEGDALGGGRVRSFFDPENNLVQIVQR